jgi:hypothetical protein
MTARSQCIVEGFLCGAEEMKKEDVVKCVSTFTLQVFKSGDHGGHVADSPAPTRRLELFQCI